MNIKYRLVLLIALIIIFWKAFNHFNIFENDRQKSESIIGDHNEVIKVSVYYEALCSDSRNFIINQLAPAYEDLHDHIQLDFLPYGKAKTHKNDEKITFTCQHGPTECQANKIHACVIDILPEQRTQLKYISCMIYDNIVPLEALERCGKELKIDYNPIADCSNSNRADLLLRTYGIQTDAVKPRITFIPTIEFDGSLNVKLSLVLKDFRNVLCSLFKSKPKGCS